MSTNIDKLALYYSVAFTVIIALGAWLYFSLRHKSRLYAAFLSIFIICFLTAVLPAPGQNRFTLFYEVAGKEFKKVTRHYSRVVRGLMRDIFS